MFNIMFSSVVKSAVVDVVKTLGGRPRVFDPFSLYIVGSLAQVPGNYVEIGTWFGASALVTALVKKRTRTEGSVVCVDSFEGIPSLPGVRPSAEQVLENAAKLDVSLEVVSKRSSPWPMELHDRRWAIGYIDGNHEPPYPGQDTWVLSNKISKYLIFDEFGFGAKAVQTAVIDLINNDPKWEPFFVCNNCAVLKRHEI